MKVEFKSGWNDTKQYVELKKENGSVLYLDRDKFNKYIWDGVEDILEFLNVDIKIVEE